MAGGWRLYTPPRRACVCVMSEGEGALNPKRVWGSGARIKFAMSFNDGGSGIYSEDHDGLLFCFPMTCDGKEANGSLKVSLEQVRGNPRIFSNPHGDCSRTREWRTRR